MKPRRQWPRYNGRQSAQSGVAVANGVGNGERSLRHGALTCRAPGPVAKAPVLTYSTMTQGRAEARR